MGFFDFFKKRKKDNSYESNLELLFGSAVNEETIRSIQEGQERKTVEQKIHYAENCCEQVIACSKHMEEATHEYNEVNKYLNDIHTIENLPDDLKKELDYYAKRVVVLGNEKTGFKKYSSEIPEKAFVTIQTREKEMPKIIKTMAEDELYCENVKKDLTTLEGEKLELKYDRRNYAAYVNAMRTLTLIGFFTVIVVAIMMMYSYFNSENGSGMSILIISIVAAIFVTIVFVANRNLLYKLKVIELKLNEIIGISDKIKLKYVNVRVKLDYEYNLYDVNNAYELGQRYKTYLKAKKEQEAFAKTADTLYHSMNSLTEILKKLNLHDYSVWNSQVGAIIDPKEMTEIKHMLNERRQRLRDTIESNKKMIDNSRDRIKKLVYEDKENAGKILEVLSKYDEKV
ncbi:MAG: hypothetical protein E7266_00845 [Lachnospiraceae bacterium]|nr:hypothetical protein [Lachnospiraceae bacterium]